MNHSFKSLMDVTKLNGRKKRDKMVKERYYGLERIGREKGEGKKRVKRGERAVLSSTFTSRKETRDEEKRVEGKEKGRRKDFLREREREKKKER